MIGVWKDDSIEAPDGTKYHIASELVRGEGRYYWARKWDGQRWNEFFSAFDGSRDKRVVKARIERLIRDTHMP